MQRITRATLDDRLARAARALILEPEDFLLQRSDSGYSVFRRFGRGWQALRECMTARDCEAFLVGLEIGALIQTELSNVNSNSLSFFTCPKNQ
jgi:hypothetical protein